MYSYYLKEFSLFLYVSYFKVFLFVLECSVYGNGLASNGEVAANASSEA